MIIPSATEAIFHAKDIFCPGKTIVDFGDQGLFDASHANALFGLNLSGDKVSMVDTLYKHLGCKREIVDLKEGCIRVDLNHSIKSDIKLKNLGDITTNHGTSEHVYNQVSFFEAMHIMTKPGGHMMHVLNCQGWADGNGYGHGFFLYQPKFISLLAKYNNYNIIRFWYSPSSPSPVIKEFSPVEYPKMVLPQYWSNQAYPHFSSLIVIFEKQGNSDFRIPQEYEI